MDPDDADVALDTAGIHEAYIRKAVHDGAVQWVLFDQDGVWIAASLDRWRVFALAANAEIRVVTLH